MSFTTTLDKVVLSKATSYKVLVKSLYFEVKPVKSFFKGVGRLRDTGSSTLWVEVIGSTKKEVEERAKNVMTGKVAMCSNMSIKKSHWYSGDGLVVDINPRQGAKCNPVAVSHPDALKFTADTPAPAGKIKSILLSSGGERLDVRGVVTEVVPSQNKANKNDAWIKDDSGDEILAELWGNTFVQQSTGIVIRSVVQLDNFSVKVSGTGARTLSGEHFKDSEKAHSWMIVDPKGKKTEDLKKLGSEKANRISKAWAGSGFSRMDSTGDMYPADDT